MEQPFIFWKLIVIQLYFLQITIAQQNLDVSPNYKILSYYGSREMDFLQREFVLIANVSSFYWKMQVDQDQQEQTYYIVDTSNNVIYQKGNDNHLTVLAGIYQQSGWRDGDLKNTLFNEPFCVCFFRKNQTKAFIQQYKQLIIVKDTSECQNVNENNFTNCLDIQPKKSYYNITDTEQFNVDQIKLSQLKEIYVIPAGTQLPDPNESEEPVLIVADRNNHCIRKILLNKKITTTIAGICGTQGLMDGPLGINLFSYPESIGVDDQGVIFVYDSNNTDIRMIDLDGFVSTLIKGACRQDTRLPNIQLQKSYTIKPVICYKNWIKTKGWKLDNIYIDKTKDICIKHFTQCEQQEEKDDDL